MTKEASSETPQDAGEVERRERWAEVLLGSRNMTYEGYVLLTHAIAEADREHADLVKRAEDAEAREARLRSGIEALAERIEGWQFHRGYCSMDFEDVSDLLNDLHALLATPDADAQDEGVQR